ncbi:MAG: hypothetical protein JWP94_5 [Mucilaginibacter sp.]|nr:hypothetical protein [Mucilaginibacter sp.]
MAQTPQPKPTIAIPAKTQVTGIVHINSAGEYPPVNMQNLTVNIYQVTLSTEVLLLSLVPDGNGLFNGELAVAAGTTLMARLYLNTAGKAGEEKPADETGPHCPQNGYVYIEFKYDPAKFSGPLYTWASALVTPQLGRNKLSTLNHKQLEQLQCIAGVGKQTLARLVNTDRLLTDLQTNRSSCSQKMQAAIKQKSADSAYLEKAIAGLTLLSNPDSVAPILFALLRGDNSLELQQALTISSAQLMQKIQGAVNDNTINPVSNELAVIDGLIALRNCILFNSNDDNYFYDAKLIYLTAVDMATKSTLLDSAIEAGSLSGFLGNEDSLNSMATSNSN